MTTYRCANPDCRDGLVGDGLSDDARFPCGCPFRDCGEPHIMDDCSVCGAAICVDTVPDVRLRVCKACAFVSGNGPMPPWQRGPILTSRWTP